MPSFQRAGIPPDGLRTSTGRAVADHRFAPRSGTYKWGRRERMMDRGKPKQPARPTSRRPTASRPGDRAQAPGRISLRSARLTDATELLAMMAPFNRSEDIPWRPRRVALALRRLLRDSRLGAVIVAEEKTTGALIGYVVATLNYDLEFAGSDAFVTELFVVSRHRGFGLGRRLLSAMTTRMRALGAGALHLLVRPDNQSARRLYEGAGFQVVPRLMMTRSFLSERRPARALPSHGVADGRGRRLRSEPRR
jgi:ribosomal protein S18 acetylase RimI-like enzyme